MCSNIDSLTGDIMLVIKLGALSYKKCSGKHITNAIITPSVLSFLSDMYLSPFN